MVRIAEYASGGFRGRAGELLTELFELVWWSARAAFVSPTDAQLSASVFRNTHRGNRRGLGLSGHQAGVWEWEKGIRKSKVCGNVDKSRLADVIRGKAVAL